MGLRIYRAPGADVIFTQTIHVPPGQTVNVSAPGQVKKGITHKVAIEEVGGESPSEYNVSLFSENTFTSDALLYAAEAVDPAATYEDFLPFYTEDKGKSGEAHIQIKNNDVSKGATFNITLHTAKMR